MIGSVSEPPTLSDRARRDFALVIPAFNEAEVVPVLIRELREAFERHQLEGEGETSSSQGEGAQQPPPWLVKTAMCAEVRDGTLRIFLPPLQTAEAFLQLATALERTCELTGLRVQLEGYPAPDDSRLKVFKLTPDPGVLEVNVPPTSNWAEQLEQTEQLYPEQGLTLEQAIEAYTMGAAYQMGWEKRIGSIEAGKRADLVVTSQNLFEIEPSEIHKTHAILTMLGGKVVHEEAVDWSLSPELAREVDPLGAYTTPKNRPKK